MGASFSDKVKQKTGLGKSIPPNKDRVRVTLKSGFYLRRCWRKQGIKTEAYLTTKLNMSALEKGTISLTFFICITFEKEVTRNPI